MREFGEKPLKNRRFPTHAALNVMIDNRCGGGYNNLDLMGLCCVFGCTHTRETLLKVNNGPAVKT